MWSLTCLAMPNVSHSLSFAACGPRWRKLSSVSSTMSARTLPHFLPSKPLKLHAVPIKCCLSQELPCSRCLFTAMKPELRPSVIIVNKEIGRKNQMQWTVTRTQDLLEGQARTKAQWWSQYAQRPVRARGRQISIVM